MPPEQKGCCPPWRGLLPAWRKADRKPDYHPRRRTLIFRCTVKPVNRSGLALAAVFGAKVLLELRPPLDLAHHERYPLFQILELGEA